MIFAIDIYSGWSAVSALVSIPAGRIVDRYGSTIAINVGLCALLTGALAMAFIPMSFGVNGYVTSLVPITSGYALFHAADNRALMVGAHKEQRGVPCALLSLARNLGLVIGASAMGALFAFGSGDVQLPGVVSGGQAGPKVTFLAAAGLALIALANSVWSARAKMEQGGKAF